MTRRAERPSSRPHGRAAPGTPTIPADGRYELGTRLIELGTLAERRHGLRAKARTIAENLMRLADATTIVHRVQERELTLALTMVPTDVLAAGHPKGRHIRLHVGIAPAVLSWLPDREIRAVLAEIGSSPDQDNWAVPLLLGDCRDVDFD